MKSIKLLTFILFLLIFTFNHVSALEFIISGQVYETYDDNIFSSSEDPESDWITDIILGLGIKSERREFEMLISGNLYQQYYVNNSDQNGLYEDLSASLEKSFSQTVTISLEDTFEHYPESETFGALFGKSEEQNSEYISNYFTSELSINMTRQFAVGFSYNNTVVKNEEDIMPDSVLHEPGGYFAYSFNSANILKAGYIYGRMKYDSGNKIISHRGYGDYQRYFTRQFYSVLSGGYDYIREDATDVVSKSYMGSLSFIDDVDKNNQLDLTFLKERSVSSVDEDIFDSWEISLALKRDISERASADLSLFYGEGTYKESDITNKLAGASASLSFAVTEFISFFAEYSYTWSSTEVPDSDESSYDRNQVSAGISGEY